MNSHLTTDNGMGWNLNKSNPISNTVGGFILMVFLQCQGTTEQDGVEAIRGGLCYLLPTASLQLADSPSTCFIYQVSIHIFI